ncbi:MAG: hypothetical protein NVS1B2_04990 [Vulcanimicrobiaceae bacterium]
MSDAVAASRALERAIDDAYEIFGAYEVGRIDFCTCCHTRIESLVAALRAPDRRALAVVDVAEFFEDVFTDASADEATFKALLPRVLECATPGDDEIAHLSVATLGRKLAVARFERWPARERAAVDAWAQAWFTATLACGDAHGTALDDVLCALGHMYDDLAPFLTQLHDARDPLARQQIAHLVLTVCFALSPARSPLRDDWSCVGARWRKDSRPERQMLTWLATHASHARLIVDATAGGCRCVWVRDSSAADVDAALATFAVRLALGAISAG